MRDMNFTLNLPGNDGRVNGAGGLLTIAVVSGKGGVGKTNVSVNLAAVLAREGKAVMLMDADLGLANVDVMLGIRPFHDLSHVIDGEKSLVDIIIRGPLGMNIVPASSGIGRMAGLSVEEYAKLIRAFGELSMPVDVLIIDIAAGISESVVNFSKAAQELIVVVCDEPASIMDAYGLIKVINKEHGIKRCHILANMVRDSEHGRKLYAKIAAVAQEYLDVSLGYLGSVPMDERLKEAVRCQSPVVKLFPGSAAAVAFRGIANKVIKLPPAPFSSGRLEFFFERRFQMVKGEGRAS